MLWTVLKRSCFLPKKHRSLCHAARSQFCSPRGTGFGLFVDSFSTVFRLSKQSDRVAANFQQTRSDFAAKADRIDRFKFREALQHREISAQYISFRTRG